MNENKKIVLLSPSVVNEYSFEKGVVSVCFLIEVISMRFSEAPSGTQVAIEISSKSINATDAEDLTLAKYTAGVGIVSKDNNKTANLEIGKITLSDELTIDGLTLPEVQRMLNELYVTTACNSGSGIYGLKNWEILE